MSEVKKDTASKSIGGQVSPELYWAFKETQGRRHETATQALEHAILLYIDADKEEREAK